MNEPKWFLEQKRELVYETALALYTVEYLNKHRGDAETLAEDEELTNPLYIKGRFDANQGTFRHGQFLEQAKHAVIAILERAAHLVEASAKPFPHPACKVVAVDFGTGGVACAPVFDQRHLLSSYGGEHNDDCPYTIAARLRDLKAVL